VVVVPAMSKDMEMVEKAIYDLHLAFENGALEKDELELISLLLGKLKAVTNNMLTSITLEKVRREITQLDKKRLG
jgi:hypothetical protein